MIPVDTISEKPLSKSPSYIPFGPHLINRKFATEHFLITGASGSGKTTLIEIEVGGLFEASLDFRALTLDPKSDLLPVFFKLAGDTGASVSSGQSRVKPMNCFDRRGFAWSMGEDVESPVLARRTASILVDQGGSLSDNDSFFRNALLDLATGVQIALMNAPNPKAWTFRDLLLALMFEPYTRFVLSNVRLPDGSTVPMFERLLSSYVDCDPRLSSSMRSTVSANLGIYEPIAACWDAARRLGRTLSLKDWAANGSNSVIVLGSDEAARSSMEALNRLLFQRAVDLILARPEATPSERDAGENQTWVILDEVRDAGKLDGLTSLMIKGRSKNAAVILSFQDINGLKDVYGEELATEMIGQCNNSAYLRLGSPETAKWATESFGERLTRGRGSGVGRTKDGESYHHEVREESRPYLYSSDLLYLPLASKSHGLSGYYRLAGVEPQSKDDLFGHLSAADVERMRPSRPDLDREPWMVPFIPRPILDQYLKPWDAEDWSRLGFPGAPPPWRYGEEQPGPSVSEMMQAYMDGPDRSH